MNKATGANRGDQRRGSARSRADHGAGAEMISERSRSQREHNCRPDGSANLLPRCANSMRDQKLRLRKFAGLAAIAAMLALFGASGRNPAATEAKGIRLRGERAISRQTIAQGRPDALRWTCMRVCALLCAAHETAGAARTRSSLRPRYFGGHEPSHQLGARVACERRGASGRFLHLSPPRAGAREMRPRRRSPVMRG
jgi:hypothetical protein